MFRSSGTRIKVMHSIRKLVFSFPLFSTTPSQYKTVSKRSASSLANLFLILVYQTFNLANQLQVLIRLIL